ncbi:ribosome recycling factor [Viridothelium virens]|uniref:Ribosome recycling factor n=1 Tax=Viridothelium virens TaxID=1048519 RepID=A0A6A6HBX6_VIRVR|nr:ribosome recycling factor [Viridothelium virens]
MNAHRWRLQALLPQASPLVSRWCSRYEGCRVAALRPSTQLQWQTRSFKVYPSLNKKRDKATREEGRPKGEIAGTEDPYDFAVLNRGIEESMSQLTADLDKLRPGGRFNPEILEAVTVALGKGNSGHKQKLGSLAQIVPKGRTLTVFVEDQDHVKSITSAILASNLNLTPQPASDNPSNLIINLPPTTKESRDQAVATAQKAADVANNKIRNARQAQHKKLRQMQLDKKARPDDLKKAGDKMEKAVAEATSKVKTEVDKKKKVLSSA